MMKFLPPMSPKLYTDVKVTKNLVPIQWLISTAADEQRGDRVSGLMDLIRQAQRVAGDTELEKNHEERC